MENNKSYIIKTKPQEWYRQTVWNTEVEEYFEAKLKRSRVPFKKVQYMRIQAYMWMKNKSDSLTQEKGVQLGLRTFKEFAEYVNEDLRDSIKGQAMFSKYLVGEHFLKVGNYPAAETVFRDIVEYFYDEVKNPEKRRPHNAKDADLMLARAIIESKQDDKVAEIYGIIDSDPFWKDTSDKFFSYPSTRYNYPCIMAFLCEKMGYYDSAAGYAKLALEVVKNDKPFLGMGHLRIAPIEPFPNDLEKLREMTEKYKE